MRPWILWLMKHRCRWVVFTYMVISTPVFFGVYAIKGIAEGASDFGAEWRLLRRFRYAPPNHQNSGEQGK